MDYISCLREDNESFERLDFCTTCWEKQDDQTLTYWTSTIPLKRQETKRELFLNMKSMIIDFLTQDKLKEAFVLAQLLKRQGVLKIKKRDVSHGNHACTLYQCCDTEEVMAVPNISIHIEEMQTIADHINPLFLDV